MYMGDYEYLPRMKKELDTLMQTTRIYSQDTGIEFWIEKCALHVIKKCKRESMEL